MTEPETKPCGTAAPHPAHEFMRMEVLFRCVPETTGRAVTMREIRERLGHTLPEQTTCGADTACGHPLDEHSVYGCADGCACEWTPRRAIRTAAGQDQPKESFGERLRKAGKLCPCGFLHIACDTEQDSCKARTAGQDRLAALTWAEGVASHGSGPTATVDIDVTIPGQDDPVPLEIPLDAAQLLHQMLGDLIAEHDPGAGQDQPADRREKYAMEIGASRAFGPQALAAAVMAVADEEQRDLYTILQAERGQADRIITRLRAELAQARSATLTAAERQFLTFAMDLAFDEMVSNDEFTEDDEAALEKFRRMAAEAQQVEPSEEMAASLRRDGFGDDEIAAMFTAGPDPS